MGRVVKVRAGSLIATLLLVQIVGVALGAGAAILVEDVRQRRQIRRWMQR